MRIGIIADIHGNAFTLQAVLAELDRQAVDQIVCLGDVANLGPDPVGVIRILRERAIPTVIGNADVWLVPEHPVPSTAPDAVVTNELTRWTAGLLDESDKGWLRSLPLVIDVPFADRVLRACHGSPRSVDDVLAARTEAAELDLWIDPDSAVILANGHTHVPLLRRHRLGHLLNPGSAGLPGVGPGDAPLVQNVHVDWVEYAVIEAIESALRFEMVRLPVDLEKMESVLQASAMPHKDWWRGRWKREVIC